MKTLLSSLVLGSVLLGGVAAPAQASLSDQFRQNQVQENRDLLIKTRVCEAAKRDMTHRGINMNPALSRPEASQFDYVVEEVMSHRSVTTRVRVINNRPFNLNKKSVPCDVKFFTVGQTYEKKTAFMDSFQYEVENGEVVLYTMKRSDYSGKEYVNRSVVGVSQEKLNTLLGR